MPRQPLTMRAYWRNLPLNPFQLARAILRGDHVPLTLEAFAARTAQRPMLLIESNDLIARVYPKAFRGAGLNVLTARSGTEGLTICERQSLALILCAGIMSDMTGLEVLRVVRQHPRTRTVPFGLFADAPLSVAEEARHAGATGFIPKTVDSDVYYEWMLAMVNAPEKWHGPSQAEIDADRVRHAPSE